MVVMDFFGTDPSASMFAHVFHVDIKHESYLAHLLRNIMTALEQLQADVAATPAINAAAVSLLATLTSQIADLVAASGNSVDPAALAALSAQVQAQNAALQAGVTANTPAVPAPVAPAAT